MCLTAFLKKKTIKGCKRNRSKHKFELSPNKRVFSTGFAKQIKINIYSGEKKVTRGKNKKTWILWNNLVHTIQTAFSHWTNAEFLCHCEFLKKGKTYCNSHGRHLRQKKSGWEIRQWTAEKTVCWAIYAAKVMTEKKKNREIENSQFFFCWKQSQSQFNKP